MSMTQEEIEALMGGSPFLSKEEIDYGCPEFENLINNYNNTDGILAEFEMLQEHSGDNPSEIYDYYKKLLIRNITKIKNHKEYIINLQKFIKDMEKIIDENPEIMI